MVRYIPKQPLAERMKLDRLKERQFQQSTKDVVSAIHQGSIQYEPSTLFDTRVGSEYQRIGGSFSFRSKAALSFCLAID